eukprot:scaffold37760_cov116-Skeletonema_marinoi.AAC.3
MVDIGHQHLSFSNPQFRRNRFWYYQYKRSFWVPFTYNKKRQDKREQIKTKYIRSIFVPFSRWGEYMLRGTGNVSLAMNSAFTYGRNKTAFLVGDLHAYCYV